MKGAVPVCICVCVCVCVCVCMCVCMCVDLDLHFVIRLHYMLIESLAYTFFISFQTNTGNALQSRRNPLYIITNHT